MRRHFVVVWLIFASMMLAGCAFYQHAILVPVCPVENWLNEIECDSRMWMRGADEWFIHGNSNCQAMPRKYDGAPLIAKKIKTPCFSRLKVNGDFQLHIVGSIGRQGVEIEGPRNAIPMIGVRVVRGTLVLWQLKNAPNMSTVIVRINMNCLNHLEQYGRGRIEGIQIRGNLDIFSSGSGNIYLRGPMNVRNIRNVGRGCINVFGAETRVLDIQTDGLNKTNVCGNIGIRSIMHRGKTIINIIGANSDCLKILAVGSGKIGISGLVNACELRALNTTRVYINKVLSGGLNVSARQNAHVGLAGNVNDVYIHADEAAYVSASRLCADSAFVRAAHNAHVNINARAKIFADAADNSSIYFFGNPAILSQFSSDNGMIVAMQK